MLSPIEDAERQDLQAWRAELLRALGGTVDGVEAVLVEGVVRSRAVLANLGDLARAADRPERRVFPRRSAAAVVRMAHWLRKLGLTRQDLSALDLGRRRRRVQ